AIYCIRLDRNIFPFLINMPQLRIEKNRSDFSIINLKKIYKIFQYYLFWTNLLENIPIHFFISLQCFLLFFESTHSNDVKNTTKGASEKNTKAAYDKFKLQDKIVNPHDFDYILNPGH
ncbi:hypothetical protein BpHYR1_028372, partial [Brachionus plicatilis]